MKAQNSVKSVEKRACMWTMNQQENVAYGPQEVKLSQAQSGRGNNTFTCVTLHVSANECVELQMLRPCICACKQKMRACTRVDYSQLHKQGTGTLSHMVLRDFGFDLRGNQLNNLCRML